MKPNYPGRGTSTLRNGRMSMEGREYLITFCTFQRRPMFASADVAICAVASLSELALWRSSKLHSWVLMPDHFHGLIELHGESLSQLIGRVKAVSSAAVRRCSGIETPTWMSGFHDRALRDGTEISLADQYIALNPQRAGLGDGYPYLKARCWEA